MAEILSKPQAEDSIWVISLKQSDLINGLKIKDLKFSEKYNVPIVRIIDNNGKSLINPQTEKVL